MFWGAGIVCVCMYMVYTWCVNSVVCISCAVLHHDDHQHTALPHPPCSNNPHNPQKPPALPPTHHTYQATAGVVYPTYNTAATSSCASFTPSTSLAAPLNSPAPLALTFSPSSPGAVNTVWNPCCSDWHTPKTTWQWPPHVNKWLDSQQWSAFHSSWSPNQDCMSTLWWCWIFSHSTPL